MRDLLKEKVLSGLLWRGFERLGAQLAGFVVSIILARLLEPKDFGTITLITVFIALASVFVSGGFNFALVQRKEVTEEDYNSIFYLSLCVATLFYVVLFVSAPWIASFYNEPVLVRVLRILSLTLILGALSSIQGAVLTREMNFKLSFKVSMASALVSGVIGVGMAILGFGLWALVGSTLVAQVVSTAVLWKIVAWRPQLQFSFRAVRNLFGFGSKMLLSGLLDTFFNNLYNVIIGKLFNPIILGHYSRGQSIPNLVMSSVQGTISGVIFPALSTCQHDRVRVKEIMRRMIKSTCFLVFPMMFGLAAVAKPLVLLLLTEKWLPCVPYLRLSCITFAFWPLHVANLQAIMALGRSDIFLKLEILKKALTVVMILCTFKFGVMAMVVGQVSASLLSVVINAWPNRRLLNYSAVEQFHDVMPSLLLSSVMAAFVWAPVYFISNGYICLAVQLVAGMCLYLGGALLLKMESAEYIWRTGFQVGFLALGGFSAKASP